jgi:hypothetical protein
MNILRKHRDGLADVLVGGAKLSKRQSSFFICKAMPVRCFRSVGNMPLQACVLDEQAMITVPNKAYDKKLSHATI